MSVDLAGYHLFDDGESSSDDDDEAKGAGMTAPPKKKMHNHKISVDLRGFDLFDDSDSEDDDDEEFGKVSAISSPVKTKGKAISEAANANFKKAQKLYLKEDEDEDLKGFHLFDEYNDDDDSDEVIKLHELENGQLAALVRSLLVENAILKDASSRARHKIDSRKAQIKELERNKVQFVKIFAEEMEKMRDLIRGLVQQPSSSNAPRSKTFS